MTKMAHNSLFVLVGLLVGAVLVIGRGHSKDPGSEAVVWLSTGKYLVLDKSDFQTIRAGDIWADVAKAKLTAEESKLPSGLSTIKVVTDFERNRAFLVVGIPKAEEYLGFVVFELSGIKPVGLVREPMSIGPVTILPALREGKLYVTFLRTSQTVKEHIEAITATFDAPGLNLMQEHPDDSLQLGPSSCLLNDGQTFYANGRVFDTRTSKELRESRFFGKPYIAVDCASGRVLLVSRSSSGTFIFTVYDPASDQVISEITTALEFRLNEGEWRLSRDGRVIIQDEQKTTIEGNMQMVSRTNRLVLYEVQSRSKVGEIRFPGTETDSGIVDQSADGRYVFYRMANNLYMADVKEKKIVHEFQLNFAPIGVSWP